MTSAAYNSRSIRKLTTPAAIREARGGSAPIMPDEAGAVWRVGREDECTSPLTRQAETPRGFESLTLRNPFWIVCWVSRATMAQGFIRRNRSAVAKRNRTLDSIGEITRKPMTARKDGHLGLLLESRQGYPLLVPGSIPGGPQLKTNRLWTHTSSSATANGRNAWRKISDKFCQFKMNSYICHCQTLANQIAITY